MPQKQRPRGRLWLNDGSCVRLRPERANHVWAYDFVSAMTHDGRTVRLLGADRRIHTRVSGDSSGSETLASDEVIEALADVRGIRTVPSSLTTAPSVAKNAEWLGSRRDVAETANSKRSNDNDLVPIFPSRVPKKFNDI